jgi:hypothetical protein
MSRPALLVLAAFLVLTLAGPSALALETVPNARIDRALYPKHDSQLVVVGKILTITPKANARDVAVIDGIDPSFDMTFQIDTVLFGSVKDKTLAVHAASFDWPTPLLDQKVGTYCILILRDHEKAEYLETVIPAKPGDYKPAKDYAALTPVIAEQILAQLGEEKKPLRQWYLLRQVGPILGKEQVQAVEPFLDSKDAWVRRAALAAATWATMDAKRIAAVQKDVDEFVSARKPDVNKDLVYDLDSGMGYAPMPLFFSVYFFLDTAWSNEEGALKVPLLPVFRQIAADTRLHPYDRWAHGYAPLCRSGTIDDARTLWECYSTKDEDFRKEAFQFDANRQAILMALSRMYDLKLSNLVGEHFTTEEPKQAAIIRRTLIDRKVIRE